MNFDERDTHWENILQDKANLSQSFIKDSCCKICLCLELLKLSVCNDSCFHPQEEAELVDRLLQGILDPQTFSVITDKLKQHLHNIVFVSTFENKLSDLESSLKKHTQKMIDLDISSSLEKLSKYDRLDENSKFDALNKRINNYEETLINLKKENDELRLMLQRAKDIHEEYIQSNKKSANEIKSEFEYLRDEQNRLRASIDVICKSISDNAGALKDIKNNKEDSEIRPFRMIPEEQKEFVEKTQAMLKKLQETGGESEKMIDKASIKIQEIKKRQDSIENWQKECKTLSRHSSHLLSASDSVYSSLQQFQEFNLVIEEKLKILKNEIDIRVLEKKSIVIEELYHPGLHNFDDGLQKYCWTCCKAAHENRGCQKRFKINE